jgi:hypothetical protein
MSLAWALLEFLPRLRWSNRSQSRRWSMNLFRRRYVAPGVTIHASVKERIEKTPYRPKNLPASHSVEA